MNATNNAALAQLLRTLFYAEDQVRRTGSADDCHTAARYCREVATQAAYADKRGFFDRSGEWDARAEARRAASPAAGQLGGLRARSRDALRLNGARSAGSSTGLQRAQLQRLRIHTAPARAALAGLPGASRGVRR